MSTKKAIFWIFVCLLVAAVALTGECHLHIYKHSEQAETTLSEVTKKDKDNAINVSETTSETASETTTKKKQVEGSEKFEEYSVPEVSQDFKSWTNYEVSVNRESEQWRILNQEGTWTDYNGFRRYNNDYMCAMGTYYVDNLGDRFRITTTDNVFTVTICDIKDDAHTDKSNQYTVANDCIVEFYVATTLCQTARYTGNCSSVEALSGRIIKIEKIVEN